jgi:hypothetical protein
VAVDELTRCPLPSVRDWPICDLIAAHAFLDLVDEQRAADRGKVPT